MSLAKAIVEGNVQVHDETLGFVPLEVTGVPEDEQVFFENGDFEGLLKHMQEKGEIGTAKPSKKTKKSKKSITYRSPPCAEGVGRYLKVKVTSHALVPFWNIWSLVVSA